MAGRHRLNRRRRGRHAYTPAADPLKHEGASPDWARVLARISQELRHKPARPATH
jgi:hypothetical protein